MIRLTVSLSLLLLAASLCMAQQATRPDDVEFEALLLKLLKPMQPKQIPNYVPGTELTIQEYMDGKPYGPESTAVMKALSPEYPATSPLPDPLLTKLEENDPEYIFKPRPVELKIDGHTVKCLLKGKPPPIYFYPLAFRGQGYMSPIQKQWVLAADPTIVLRDESIFSDWDKWFWPTSPASWWAVTAVGVIKKVGDREHVCVEVKHDFYFGADGYNITTDYLTPDVPGFYVEFEKVFYQVGKDRQKKFTFVRTWKLLNIKVAAK